MESPGVPRVNHREQTERAGVDDTVYDISTSRILRSAYSLYKCMLAIVSFV